MARVNKNKKKPVRKLANITKADGLFRRPLRTRVQTVLHQAPDFTVHKKQPAKKAIRGGAKVSPKVKGAVAKVAKGVTKKATGKKGQKTPKAKKEPASKKKGNDRLVPRTGIQQYKENPFIASQKKPEYVSFSVNGRRLIRALKRKSAPELKEFIKDKRYGSFCNYETFSFAINTTAELEACRSRDRGLMTEYFKFASAAASQRHENNAEPNLLQMKTTGKSNFYMIGRATRNIEMTRGGREGNNALLNYAGDERNLAETVVSLIRENIPYTDLVVITKIPHANIAEHQLESHVVTAVRVGHRSLASALAQGVSRHNFNDLHRETLEGKLPAKILPVSVVKKGFNNRSITPVHTAAITNDSKLLEKLRSIDPNINVPDQDNWYTIHYAAVCDGPEPLKYLLKNGGVVSSLTKKQETPLHAAARAGRAQNIRLIIKAMLDMERPADGVDRAKPEKSLINSRNRKGLTALQLAVVHNKLEAVDAFLEHDIVVVDAPTSTTTNKLTALMIACSRGFLPIAEKLIAKGALIEQKEKKKRTSLIHAVLNGQEHIVAMLLARGANIHAADSSGNTSAHYAAAYGWLDVLKLLVQVDPTVLTAQNDWALTTLSIAYLKGHYGIVTWLLDGPHSASVDINGKDTSGATLLASLLSYATDNYHSQMDGQIEYLVKRGADAGIADSMGTTALHVFANMSITLKGTSGDKDEAREAQRMTEAQYRHCFDLLIESGAQVDAKTSDGRTPIQLALNTGNLLLFDLMLGKVKDIQELFKNWTDDGNILHQLFAVPAKVYENPTLWKGSGLTRASYNVIPIIKDVIEKRCKSELQEWIEQSNKEGFPPLVEALFKYRKLNFNNTVTKAEHEQFIATIVEIFTWALNIRPEMLKKTFTGSKEGSQPLALAHLSLSVPIEQGCGSSYHLFTKLMNFAYEKGILMDFLKMENEHGNEVIIYAADNAMGEAVELILKTTKQYNMTRGIHDAVMKYHLVDGKKTEINRTLLMILLKNGYFDYLPLVEISPENWNAIDSASDNLWHYAARVNHHRTVSVFKLLESKCVPRIANSKKRTPLHEAALACDGSVNAVLESVAFLSTRGRIGDTDKYGRTALHYVFGKEHEFENETLGSGVCDPISVVVVLANVMDKNQLNIADVDGNTVLHLAAMKDASISTVMLIRKGCEIDVKNSNGNTPLSLAVFLGRQATALTLIQANASVVETIHPWKKKEHAKKKNEWVWDGAVKQERKEETTTIPAQVVSKGAGWEAMVYVLLDVLGQNANSMAQLTDAALKRAQFNLANQLLKTLETLLDGKPLISNFDLLDTFTKHHQGGLTNESIERTVLQKILDIGGVIMNEDGTSQVIETALRFGSLSTLNYLKDKLGAEKWSRLRPISPEAGPIRACVLQLSRQSPAYSVDHSPILNELAAMKNLNINAPLEFKIPAQFRECGIGHLPPISWAALCGKKNLIKYLRAAGADVKAVDSQGRTPLMFAVLANDVEAVDAIIGDGNEGKIHDNPTPKKAAQKTQLLFGQVRKRKNTGESDEDGEDSTEENSAGEEEEEDPQPTPSGPVCVAVPMVTTSQRMKLGHFRASVRARVRAAPLAKKADDQPPVKRIKLQNSEAFTQKDHNGRSVLHYLVQPIPWENVDLLETLNLADSKLVKQLLTSPDGKNQTPVDLAKKSLQRQMFAAMSKLTGSKQTQTLKVDGEKVDDLKADLDVNGDCAKFIKKWAEVHDKKKKAEVPKPHRISGFKDGGEVVYCEETKQYFDVLLNKTDLSYGTYGFHNFYRMQLIKRRDADLWILFTNWGRIGQGEGENQTTPFSVLALAIKEFKSVWKSKTGQEWAPLSEFAEQPKKYRLVENDSSPTNLADVDIPKYQHEEKDVIRRMIRDISEPEKLKNYAKQNSVFSITSMPFGRVSYETIERAEEILDQCEKNFKDLEALLLKDNKTDAEVLSGHQKAIELSSEFYSIIPTGEYEFTALRPIIDLATILQSRRLLNRLKEVEVATRLLTASVEQTNLDRIDYIHKALECRFTLETPKSDVSQRILQYIHSSNSRTSVKAIIELAPRTSVTQFEPFLDDDNQIYLWHGTRAFNLLSILKDGILVDPPNTSRNGQLFGSGVYLSDAFEKSLNYCQESANGDKYMLLCKVAMGKVRELTDLGWDDDIDKKMDEDTLQYVGQQHPSGSLTFGGVKVPLLPLKTKKNNTSGFYSLPFSEYIVRDAHRVVPKFIIIFK
ncbi:unnamed protein product [Caenorhabditis auriculariae]|uniref:Poly [ADP-ribose] polymerase n=1 Tax=Caenorhabditis auriculariae TaxID=2777116 RepID=A0A8S1GW41_9PELO|nr:unnamed protein product [Caenorhabditis auriculariae]